MRESPAPFSSEPKKNSPLSPEAAREEADMLRATLNVSPETGKIHEPAFDRELRLFYELKRAPTAEDYDAALQAVEELVELAKNEPTSEKLFNAFARLSGKTVYGVTSVMNVLAGPISDSRQTFIDKDHGIWMAQFEDASSKLKTLRDKAREYN